MCPGRESGEYTPGLIVPYSDWLLASSRGQVKLSLGKLRPYFKRASEQTIASRKPVSCVVVDSVSDSAIVNKLIDETNISDRYSINKKESNLMLAKSSVRTASHHRSTAKSYNSDTENES